MMTDTVFFRSKGLEANVKEIGRRMKIFIYFFGSRQNSVEMPQRFKRCCFPRKKTLEISDIGFFSAELQMKHHFDHMEQKTELLRN